MILSSSVFFLVRRLGHLVHLEARSYLPFQYVPDNGRRDFPWSFCRMRRFLRNKVPRGVISNDGITLRYVVKQMGLPLSRDSCKLHTLAEASCTIPCAPPLRQVHSYYVE